MRITELILQVKTWGKSNPFFPESSLFHCQPSLHLKGYQPDSFSYGFLKVWTVFRHSFRLLFWKMSEKEPIASVDGWVPAAFCLRQQSGQTFSLSLSYWRSYCLVEKLSIIYCKNNLRIDSKKRLTFLRTLRILFGIFVCPVVTARACGFLNIMCQPNGGILDIK